ncbi:hypothetical protein HYH03_001434 [Edaphochlamys debaryana]|uniref:Uncharacterized protein n=1 Tax=Edaphochlamys debaryana TaxID=47281 RepID=A0A836C620_9CHLO|nr:hypothetical protein HYH03_001434 [Edaphochlamys debaryana]|eukprot:KAG2500668.1 hypothetical protein HYH03_001434 [Edaphochlamys debaryana]
MLRSVTPVTTAASESTPRTEPQQPSLSSAGSAPPPGSASATEVLRHPEPSTSLEELRWRDHLTTAAGGVPAPLVLPSAPAAPAPLGALPLGGAPTFGVGAPGATPPTAPGTPLFTTPVRTLFPPTPVQLGLPGEDIMDCAESLDVESQFASIYATPGASAASPEEMRVVQMESYKLGRQIMPYWLVPGSS